MPLACMKTTTMHKEGLDGVGRPLRKGCHPQAYGAVGKRPIEYSRFNGQASL